MPFNKSHVQYVLAEFDAGIPPQQILFGLQYRAFLPSINIATIEQCLRDNGRELNDQQAGNTSQDNKLSAIGYTSNFLPPPKQSAPGPSAATQECGQSSTGCAMGTLVIANNCFTDPSPTMLWDSHADQITYAAFCARNSRWQILAMLRSRGYDITVVEILASLIRQGVKIP